MRRYSQLTTAEQTKVLGFIRKNLAPDPEVSADPTVSPNVDRIALNRARNAFYPDPGDTLIDLQTVGENL